MVCSIWRLCSELVLEPTRVIERPLEGEYRTNLEVDDGHRAPTTSTKHIESTDSEVVSMEELKVFDWLREDDVVKECLEEPVGLCPQPILNPVAHQCTVPTVLGWQLTDS